MEAEKIARGLSKAQRRDMLTMADKPARGAPWFPHDAPEPGYIAATVAGALAGAWELTDLGLAVAAALRTRQADARMKRPRRAFSRTSHGRRGGPTVI